MEPRPDTRIGWRIGGVVGALVGAGVLALSVAAPASAHVEITPSTTQAGAFAVLTVSVPHGCDGSPTTKVAIQLPDGLDEVTPTRNPFYDVATSSEGGHQVVVYTARTPLPDGQRDAFELSAQIPEEAAGSTLVFPTIQTCEEGETAWTEVPADGQSEDDLEHPAPAFTVTSTGEPDGSDSSSSADGWAIAGLVAGLLGLALGGAAFIRTRGGRPGSDGA